MIKKLLSHELVRYIIVGGGAVCIDIVVYWLLTANNMIIPSYAKRISFVAGGIWSFFGNKFFTFRSTKVSVSEPMLFAVVYIVGFLLNSMFHDFLLKKYGIKLLALISATVASVIWNYIGQKWIIFPNKKGR